jgi:hypothetical protein
LEQISFELCTRILAGKRNNFRECCHLTFHLKLLKSEADQYIGGKSANEFTRIIKPDTYFGSMVDPGEQDSMRRINT